MDGLLNIVMSLNYYKVKACYLKFFILKDKLNLPDVIYKNI